MTLIIEGTTGRAKAAPATIGAWSERLQGALMIGVLTFGAWQGAAALSAPAAQRRLTQVMDGSALLAGRTAATVNYVEAHYLPADGAFRAAGGAFRWMLFRSGGPQVRVGCQDWLYLTDELRPWPDAADHMTFRADTLARIAHRLKEQNIRLVVTLVPDKARIEHETLCGAPRSTQVEPRYGAFMDLLKARGISAVDLATPFAKAHQDGPLFYRTDTHWNQTGAALAARLVAADARMDDVGYSYRTIAAGSLTQGPGDMLRLMSLDNVPDVPLRLRPSPDLQHLEQTVQVSAPATTADLLGDEPARQVVLLGSSFSLNGNFKGRLQEALHRPVANFAEAGGGFASAAKTYFKGGAFTDSPPEMVVWEIPERVVGQPLDAADRALAEGW